MIRSCVLALLGLAVALALPAPTHAQAAAELIQTIRAGGGWVAIPISGGSADLSSDTVPTLGLTLTGCFTVWGGHSGEWTFAAQDGMSGERLDAVATPGEGVPFSVDTGMQSHLALQVRWSEPRDTVLQLWVGIEVPQRPDACTPVYDTGG